MLKMFSFFKNKTLNNKLHNLSVQKIKVFDVASPDSNFWRDVDDEMMRTSPKNYLGFTNFVSFLKNELPIVSLSHYKQFVVVLSNNYSKHIFKIVNLKKCYLLDNRELVFVLNNGDFFKTSCLDKNVNLYLMKDNGVWKDFSYGFYHYF